MPERSVEQEVQNLRAEVDRLRRRFEFQARVHRRLLSNLALPTVLQDTVDAACELTGARYGALGVFDQAGRLIEFITHGITPGERERLGALPAGMGILGLVQELQRPLRLSNLVQHPRSVGFPHNHPPMSVFLGTPLRRGDEALGNLYLTEKEGGGDFTPEDEELLALFAAHAAMVIHNARLHQGLEAGQRNIAELAAERGRLLERARQEGQRLEALVDSSLVGVVLVEAGTHRIALVNQEAQRILGVTLRPGDTLEAYEKAAVRRRPDGRVLSREDFPIRRALDRGEQTRAEELRFEFPGGRAVLTLVNATPLYSDDGAIAAAFIVIQDITPLEEIERLRTEFLGLVSHELKTPLTAIKGSAAIGLERKRRPQDAETSELFQIIEEQADRLRDLVDNLLDMTRIEAGALSVQCEPIDLRSVLSEAESTAARAGVSQPVALQLPDALPPVSADRRRVVQVLTNLLSNAARLSPPAAPITIAVERSDGMVTVHVRDQGRGIPKDRLSQLFKRFSRVHAEAGHGLSDTGLGLAICKGIVEAHGGRIWAHSAGEGKGATFSFTLQVAEQPPAPGAPTVVRRDQHLGRVRRPGQRTRILAVDDDAQVRRFLERALKDAGYEPLMTGDPSQVVRLVEAEEPDLVLMDVMLPGVTGFDLLKRIREFSGVPVIFVTARDQPDDTVKALRMGADDYIVKPFAPSELLARIEAALRRRVLPDQTEVRPPFVLGDLHIDFAGRRVTVAGRPVGLSATEYKLLYELAVNAGRVLTHDQILQRVWGPEYSSESGLIRSFVRDLRRKLGDDARTPRYILTEPRVGYRMPRS